MSYDIHVDQCSSFVIFCLMFIRVCDYCIIDVQGILDLRGEGYGSGFGPNQFEGYCNTVPCLSWQNAPSLRPYPYPLNLRYEPAQRCIWLGLLSSSPAGQCNVWLMELGLLQVVNRGFF